MKSIESRSLLLAARLISGAIIVLALYVAKPVLIPLGLALLLAFMLQPAVRWLRRRGLPNGVAVAVTAAVFFAMLGMVLWVIAGQVRALGAEMPQHREKLVDKIGVIRASVRGGSIDALKSTMTDVIKEVQEEERAADAAAADAAANAAADDTVPAAPVPEAGPPAPPEPEPAKVIVADDETTVEDLNSVASLLTPLGTAGLVVLLVVLLLLKWSDLRGRLISLVGHSLTSTTAALDDAAQRVSRYLAMQFIINVGTGLVVWAGLSVIGLEYAGLMGLCAGLFRYVPYVGPLAAAALPLLFSFASSDGWGQVMAVAGMFIVLELVLNNVIEPWVYGSSVGVSELGIILAAVTWTLLWGPAGLVLSTPLTVCLVVLGEKVPGLAFLAKLLSDRGYLPVHASLAQRLMAGDTIEATDVLADYREKASADETYDAVVVPALARVRHEQRLGLLDAPSAASIATALPPMVAELAGDEDPPPSLAKESTLAVWSLCPLTEAAATLLPHRFRLLPCSFEFFNAQALASDVIARLKQSPHLGIALLHLDATDFPRVMAAFRRLRRALPDLPVVIGRWGELPITASEKEEATTLGVAAVVATPAELAAWISPRALNAARLLP